MAHQHGPLSMDKKIINLIEFIVCYANEQDIRLTPVRLIKFLYLADYYYARWNQGKVFTQLPWFFYNFGPYCAEAIEHVNYAASAGLIKPDKYSSTYSERDYTLFSCKDTSVLDELEKTIPHPVISGLKGAIKKFGDDTPALLDYVYFETEPMENVTKGEMLDFAKANPPHKEQITLPRMSKKTVEKARSLIKEIAERQARERSDFSWSGEIKDEAYYQSLDILNKSDEIPSGIEGIAVIEKE